MNYVLIKSVCTDENKILNLEAAIIYDDIAVDTIKQDGLYIKDILREILSNDNSLIGFVGKNEIIGSFGTNINMKFNIVNNVNNLQCGVQPLID